MQSKNKSTAYSSLFFVCVLMGLFIGGSLWIQIHPPEFKSLLLHRRISEVSLIIPFVFLWATATGALFLANLLPSRLTATLISRIKIMLPLLVLLLTPLRAFIMVGDEQAWFDQTTFYVLLVFILIVAYTAYGFARIIDTSYVSRFVDKNSKKILWVVAALSVIFFGYFSLIRLFDITIEKPDSHAFITVFWNTAHGNILRSTYLDHPRSWFSLHFEPLLFLFSPLFLLTLPSPWFPLLLQLIQVVIGVSSIIPLYLFSRKKLDSQFLALIMVFIYLLFPALQFQLLYDFHIEIVSLGAILWSLYFLYEKKYLSFLLFLILAIVAREEFAIYTSLFGLFMLCNKTYSKKLGAVLLVSGILYYGFVKFYLIPSFGHGAIAPAQESMFAHLKNLGVKKGTLLDKAGYIMSFICSQRKIQYLLLMGLSTGFLSLLSPVIFLSIPFFAINLLLNFDLPSSIFWHYQSWLIPILLWASVDCIARRNKDTRLAWAVYIIVSVLLTSLYFGPVNVLGQDLGTTHKSLSDLQAHREIQHIQEVKDVIPADATLATDTGLAPFFADRRDFYLFPDTYTTDYIVSSLSLFSRYTQFHVRLTHDGYCLKAFGGILVYKKQKYCENDWRSSIEDKRTIISLDDTDTKIITANNFSGAQFPLSPKRLNVPAVLLFKTSVPQSKLSENTLYFIDYQMVAYYPSLINVTASPDGTAFKTIATCSALSKATCNAHVDISAFINTQNEVYIKLYVFADSLRTPSPDTVKVEEMAILPLRIIP